MPKLITPNVVTTKVKTRTKVYDTKCPGFYVSILPPKGDAAHGRATFSLKFWNKTLGKQDYIEIGAYDPNGWTVDLARGKAQDLSAQASRGIDIKNAVKVQKTISGMTVDNLIDDFIAEISKLEKKADGEERPALESWQNVAGFLNREVRPPIGWMVCADVTNNEIAAIQQHIAKRSTSGARQTRSAMKRLFAFGAEAGRPYGLKSSPVHNLPKVKPEHARTRVLNEEEIRILWWGLDHPSLPVTKGVALGIKFELVSMLRSKEFLNSRRSFIAGRGTKTQVLRVPLKLVKKRRVIEQPLNSLAVEIIDKACALHNHDVIFSPRSLDPEAVLNRSALSKALKGYKGKRGRMGVCEFLGLKPFTPHDLRRTAASLCGDLGISDANIAKCLDHQKGAGENVAEVPSVTGRVYVHSARLTEKRAVLDALDAGLRQIIGPRPKQLPCARTLAQARAA
jgi:integrase